MKKEAKNLLNGCSRTTVFISPKKYKTLTNKSNFPKHWFVQSRFFDPVYKNEWPKGFQYRAKFSGEGQQVIYLLKRQKIYYWKV